MKSKTGRPQNELLELRNYHDLEKGSLGIAHSETFRTTTGSWGIRVVTVTTYTTLLGTYDFILVDALGQDITITLPTALSLPFKQYKIKKIDSSQHQVKVVPASNDNIDGESEWLITFQNDCMDIISDAVDSWWMN